MLPNQVLPRLLVRGENYVRGQSTWLFGICLKKFCFTYRIGPRGGGGGINHCLPASLFSSLRRSVPYANHFLHFAPRAIDLVTFDS